jgi:protein SCO1/2
MGPVMRACGGLLAACGVLAWPGSGVPHEGSTGRDLTVSEAPRLAVIRQAPDLELLDTGGRTVTLSALRGQVVLIAFIYSTCADDCPLLTQRMVLTRNRLRTAGVETGTTFLSITVDPGRDSAEVLGEYAGRLGAASERWRFLTGDPERVRPVLRAWDEWTRPAPDGSIDHPARLYLIDARGRVREIYGLAFFDERQAYLDIRALLAEAGNARHRPRGDP